MSRAQKSLIIVALMLVGVIGGGVVISNLNNGIISTPYQGQAYTYLVTTDGSGNYFMKNGTTGAVDYSSTNFTLVEQYALGNMSSGLIYTKEVLFNSSLALSSNQMVEQEYQGSMQFFSSQGKFLIPQLAADPSTVGWTTSQQGYMWYNTVSATMKYWNGTAIVAFSSGATGPSGPAGKVDGLPFNYMCFQNSTSNYLVNGVTGVIDWSSSNASSIVNAAVGNLTNGGVIYVRSPMSIADGTITITQNQITITSGLAAGTGNSGMLVSVDTVIVDSSAGIIRGIQLVGLNLKAVTFKSNNAHSISNCIISKCAFLTDSSHHGLTILGDGSEMGYSDNLIVEDCVFTNGDQEGATYGVVNFQSIQYLTALHITTCEFFSYASNETFFYVRGDAEVDMMYVTDCNFYTDTGTVNDQIFYLQGATQDVFETKLAVDFESNRLESHQPTDILKCVDSGTAYNNTYLYFLMENCPNVGSQFAYELFNDTNTHWASRSIVVQNNVMQTSPPSIQIGTLTTGITTFTKIVNNYGLNPIGKISTPVVTTTNELSPWGTGTIATGVTYRNQGVPLDIYISGGVVTGVNVDGNTVYNTTNVNVHLEVNQTFSISWSGPPTIVVEGE